MSDIKEKATELWTHILNAMRTDGLIAESITQTGPATTGVLVELVSTPGYEGTWLPMHIHPTPGMQVVGLHQGERQWIEALLIHENRWQNADGELIDPADYECWTYIKLPE